MRAAIETRCLVFVPVQNQVQVPGQFIPDVITHQRHEMSNVVASWQKTLIIRIAHRSQ